LRSFIEAHAPGAFLVVNRGIGRAEDVRGTAVPWVLPQELAPRLADMVP